MSAISTINFEIDKSSLATTRMLNEPLTVSLEENQVLLKIDKFALTANNISYGVAGNLLGYWKFFPTNDNRWGRLPAMGYGEVQESNCADIKVGERVWGFFPMASHVVINGGKIHPGGFSDVSDYRKELSPVYATFERVSANPFYKVENENYEMLVRGLFTTSWLVDDFLFDNDYFGAEQYLITSASSKTSIALAFAVKERGEMKSIGITSIAHKPFVERLGCYDQVVTYEEIESLNSSIKSVLVDMSGSQSTLSQVHHHFNDNLCYSARIGATHHDELFMGEPLPGAEPIFFFAPTQIEKRTKDWGRGEVMKRISASLARFIGFCEKFIEIKHTTSADDIVTIYQDVLAGKADAAVGHVISIKP